MTMRTNSSYVIRGILWLAALSLPVVMLGCGKPPQVDSSAAGTAQDDVAKTAQSRPIAIETPAPEPAIRKTPPASAAETEASTPADGAIDNTANTGNPGDKSPRASQPQRSAPASEDRQSGVSDAVSLDEQLTGLQIPPAWLEKVQTKYDTSRPWKDARLEVRRLLSLNTDASRKEAIKLTWIYLQKADIGNGHEYPMYVFLGSEPLWAVRAYEEFLAKPQQESPSNAYITLASLYVRYAAFEKAKAALDKAMTQLPAPPWQIACQASIYDAMGDLYVAWGKSELAKEHYAKAVELYPTSDQPYGQHLLKRQADRVQSKLDLLSVRSLADARLIDGRYTSTALGYAGDVDVTLTVRDGRMADIKVKHQEKIDQGASVIIPQRILEKQSLQVDGVSGATVTKSAIIDGTLQCLRKAGLQ